MAFLWCLQSTLGNTQTTFSKNRRLEHNLGLGSGILQRPISLLDWQSVPAAGWARARASARAGVRDCWLHPWGCWSRLICGLLVWPLGLPQSMAAGIQG